MSKEAAAQDLVELRPGETAVVGYGSLLSVASLEKTLRHKYDGPFLACRLAGWRRVWDVTMPNRAFYYEDRGERVYPERIVYLDIRRDPASTLTAILFAVNREELAAMDSREWIYDRTSVTGDLRGVQLRGGEAVAYVGRPEHLVRDAESPQEVALRASYLSIIAAGLEARDADFRAEYERSTDPVPSHLVIDDRLDPYRPGPWTKK
jgi:hypothetical protein